MDKHELIALQGFSAESIEEVSPDSRKVARTGKIAYLENGQAAKLQTFFIYYQDGKLTAALNKPSDANFTQRRARNPEEAIALVRDSQMGVLLSPTNPLPTSTQTPVNSRRTAKKGKVAYLENTQPTGLKTFFIYHQGGQLVATFNKPVGANFTQHRARTHQEAIAFAKDSQMDVLLSPVVD